MCRKINLTNRWLLKYRNSKYVQHNTSWSRKLKHLGTRRTFSFSDLLLISPNSVRAILEGTCQGITRDHQLIRPRSIGKTSSADNPSRENQLPTFGCSEGKEGGDSDKRSSLDTLKVWQCVRFCKNTFIKLNGFLQNKLCSYQMFCFCLSLILNYFT